MKALDIALKDMLRSFRSFFAIIFMFVIPLLMTGMFYFMFGNIADSGEFSLPKTKVIVANMDEGGPKFNVKTDSIPGGKDADTMGELIVGILESDEMADLIVVSHASSSAAACTAIDNQTAQVAIIIPTDFSKKFADIDEEATIEFYQDPTLSIGPSVIRAILNRFTDGMAGVKIAINVFMDDADQKDEVRVGEVVQRYLKISLAEEDDLEAELLDVHVPPSENAAAKSENLLIRIIGPIMGGMMIFYAFYTGTSTAQSILREEEERTMPRLFTTPTSQTTILTGKFLSVFMTVSVQVIVLLNVARVLFGIRWGEILPVSLSAIGIVIGASSFGIFVNSLLKDTKQGGAIFGGVLTVTGMVGMINTFMGSYDTTGFNVSLLVPQGWAVRGLIQAMSGQPITSILITMSVLLIWSAVFFIVGVWRFTKRYE
ncbi:MAG: ABC transporter permease [Anaerolineales bacterium]|nr:ABC transporter permease [Anaerolineales bacterium]